MAEQKQATVYMVFEAVSTENNGTWRPIGSVRATNAEAAIRLQLEGQEGEITAERYAATPMRNWRMVDVKVETTTRVEVTPVASVEEPVPVAANEASPWSTS